MFDLQTTSLRSLRTNWLFEIYTWLYYNKLCNKEKSLKHVLRMLAPHLVD